MNRGGDNRFARTNYNNSNNNNNNNARNTYRPTTVTKVDREKTCPFLLRVFISQGVHRPENDFKVLPIQDEHQIYTWKDTTLTELILLLRDTSPGLRNDPLAKYSVRIVYFDTTKNSFHSREFGSVFAKDLMGISTASKDREEDRKRERGSNFDRSGSKTFEDGRFVVGDLIDIAYLPTGTATSFDRSGPPASSILGRSLDNRGNILAPTRSGHNRRASDTWNSSAGSRGSISQVPAGSSTGAPGAWGRMATGEGGGIDRGGARGGESRFGGRGNERDRFGNDQGRGDNGRDTGRDKGEAWGARRDRENGLGNKRDDPPHQSERRRSSRSLSPARRQSRTGERSRSNSPATRRREGNTNGRDKNRDANMDVEWLRKVL